MLTNLIWQQNSPQQNNAENLAQIAEWWSNLAGKEVSWKQRLIPASGNMGDISWDSQKFDEQLTLHNPTLRGITIYWQKEANGEERNITASKLELNLSQSKLYIYPQSQSQIVIAVSIPEVVYQTIELNDPQIAASNQGERYILLLRDQQQQLELKVNLDREKILQLLNSLKSGG